MDIDLEKANPELFTVRADLINPPALVQQLELSDLSFSATYRYSNLSFEAGLNEFLRDVNWQIQRSEEPDELEPGPLPDNLPAEQYDGCFIGKGGKLYCSDLSYASIPTVGTIHAPESATDFPVIYINGILNSPGRAYLQIEQLSHKTGQTVLGIYNATEGELTDVMQSIFDKFDLGYNKAARSLQNLIEDALRQNKILHIVAESQGAIIASRAISDAIQNLRECGWSEAKIGTRLVNIEVETIGGAAWVYPDGPRYVHYINDLDPIPSYFGLGKYGLSDAQLKKFRERIQAPEWFDLSNTLLTFLELDRLQGLHPGKSARIIRFEQQANSHWLDAHLLHEYLKRRMPFERAYSLEPAQSFADEDRPSFFRPLLALAGIFLSSFALRKLRKTRALNKARLLNHRRSSNQQNSSTSDAECQEET